MSILQLNCGEKNARRGYTRQTKRVSNNSINVWFILHLDTGGKPRKIN
jgi:hypothetical protein